MRAFGEWSPGLRAVLAVGGTTLFMVLVAWATLLGPDEVFTGPGPVPATTTTEPEPEPPTRASASPPHTRSRTDVRRSSRRMDSGCR